LLFAVVGGITTITGAFIGGALFALLPFVQSQYPDQAGLVFAGVAIAVVALGRQPNGVAGLVYEWFGGLRRGRGEQQPDVTARDVGKSPPVKEPVGATA
jgi:branched-chain amino acid transport system permease protein